MAEHLQSAVAELCYQNERRLGTLDDPTRTRVYFELNGFALFLDYLYQSIEKEQQKLDESKYFAYEAASLEEAGKYAWCTLNQLKLIMDEAATMDRHTEDWDSVHPWIRDKHKEVASLLLDLLDKLTTDAHACGEPSAEADDACLNCQPNDTNVMAITVTALGGQQFQIKCHPEATLFDLKARLAKLTGMRARNQRLALEEDVLDPDANPHGKLTSHGVSDGSQLTLIAVSDCLVCLGPCNCKDCHGEGRWNAGCSTCGKVREDCPECEGPCRCSDCHGRWKHCKQCGSFYPCWGGNTRVFLPDGTTQKVRECKEGDQVRTLRGHRAITKIWGSDPSCPDLNKEVCCLNGVWITAKHPVISGDQWVNPCDLVATAPWKKRRHVMPDMYSFELEGHDDTIVLGGHGGNVVVSCTLGKYLGPCFGCDVWTRRSTRCNESCIQCDSVFVPDISFGSGMNPEYRKAAFAPFPQVEWDESEQSEFHLAEKVTTAIRSRWEGDIAAQLSTAGGA